jgi:hypothetical protein
VCIASFGRTYLPGFLPPGYIFSRWESQAGSATVCGNILLVVFGKRGDLIQWTVGDASDPDGYAAEACSKHPFEATNYQIGSRRIVFQSGSRARKPRSRLARPRSADWPSSIRHPPDYYE